MEGMHVRNLNMEGLAKDMQLLEINFYLKIIWMIFSNDGSIWVA